MNNIYQAIDEINHMLCEKMHRILPHSTHDKDNILTEAMRYSIFSGGKRLRPFLTVTTARLFGVNDISAIQVAAAVEFIHTYSLIHDDLPALDNSSTRRDQDSCHIKFGEATAILAGDALLTLAFEILAEESTHSDHAVRCELISSLAHAIGASGMVGGQVIDLLSLQHDLTINEITRMHRMKTGDLFAFACEAGAILARAPKNLHIALRGYAYSLGLAFQILDDLQDYVEDKSEHRVTYVTILGQEKSQEQVKMLINQSIAHLNSFDQRADLLREFAKAIPEMFEE
jgi:farnesyl diphosphate synthase